MHATSCKHHKVSHNLLLNFTVSCGKIYTQQRKYCHSNSTAQVYVTRQNLVLVSSICKLVY